MPDGIKVRVLGDSGPFSRVGKSIAYLVTIGNSNYLLDCGATLFEQIGGFGLKTIKGLIITHCHDDHKRWFTDLAIFYQYAPDISGKVPLFASEEVNRELTRMAEPALDRSLSDDSKTIIDIPCEHFIEYQMLGPRAKYKITSLDKGNGNYQLCIMDNNGNVVGPEKGKIIINDKTKRPRMLFRDPHYQEWIEPESFYSFSATVFYEKDKNIYNDEEGCTVEGIKAPVWHGIPNIGIKFKTKNETLVFSSDTFHDNKIWKELCSEKRPQQLKMTQEKFESSNIIFGDINDYIERTWSKERYEDAINAFNDAIVIHDVSVRDSIVHTCYDRLGNTALNIDRTILTHSPDRITSVWPLCSAEKNFIIKGDRYFELVNNELYPMNADVYHKENRRYFVGYQNEDGLYTVYAKKGMHYICSEKEGWDGERLFRVDMYEDIAGMYLPRLQEENQKYVLREDGKVELVEIKKQGSTGRIVECHRSKLINLKRDKTKMKLLHLT